MSQRKCHATFLDICKVFKRDEKISVHNKNCLDNVFIFANYKVIKQYKRKNME